MGSSILNPKYEKDCVRTVIVRTVHNNQSKQVLDYYCWKRLLWWERASEELYHTCIDETHAGECVVVWREKRSCSARYYHNNNNHNSSRSITTGTYLQRTRTTLIILCSIIVYENKSFLAF